MPKPENREPDTASSVPEYVIQQLSNLIRDWELLKVEADAIDEYAAKVKAEVSRLGSDLERDIKARANYLRQSAERNERSFEKKIKQMFRFTNMEDVPAAEKLLLEKGVPMQLDEIVDELMAGGLWREHTDSQGSKPTSEIRRALSQGANWGMRGKSVIVWVDREKEIIGLVAWQ